MMCAHWVTDSSQLAIFVSADVSGIIIFIFFLHVGHICEISVISFDQVIWLDTCMFPILHSKILFQIYVLGVDH